MMASAACSFTSSIAALRYKIFLPVKRMVRAVDAHNSMINPIGNAIVLLKTLTSAELNVPTPIWMAPIKAEAVPAFFEKGANDKAEELGKVNPWQLRKQKIQATIPNTFKTFKIIPKHITTALKV